MKNIVIIEPHFDDFWLNLGGFFLINNPRFNFKIITISKHDKWNWINHTKSLTKEFPSLKTCFLGYDSLDIIKEENDSSRLKLNAKDDLELLLKMNRLENIGVLEKRIEEECKDSDLVILPMGLYHPMHKIIGKLKLNLNVAKYEEYPYRYYKSEENKINSMKKKFNRYRLDIRDVLQKKIKIFKKYYYSQLYILSIPECSTPLEKSLSEVIYSKINLKNLLNGNNK